jgi:GT2 family glycosyltransferase
MSKVYICLGKSGDILSVLPILQHEFKETGQKPFLMVAKEYAPLLDGVSFVQPVIFDGHFSDLRPAIKQAKNQFSEVIVPQIYGKDFPIEKKTPSFQLEQWHRAGCLEHFGDWPLTFDLRDKAREAALLIKHHEYGKPFILLADYSESSPFPHKEELAKLLKENFGQTHQIIRLSEVRAERLYDVLGLYDNAVALVTIETAHLHLSAASFVPTFVLATDKPSMWHGSWKQDRFAFYMRYGEWTEKKNLFLDWIGYAVKGIVPAPPPSDERVSCIIPIFKPSAKMLNRCLEAVLPQVDEVIITMEKDAVLPPSSIPGDVSHKLRVVESPDSNIGFGRNVNFGAKHAKHELLLILNDDVFLEPGAVAKMRKVMGPKVGIVGHLLKFENGTIYCAERRRKSDGAVGFTFEDFRQTVPTLIMPQEVEHVSGASMLVRRSAFMEVGGFDPAYFLYNEDDDAVLRIRKAGWQIWYTPWARGTHVSQAETRNVPKINEVMAKSGALFTKVWKPYFEANRGNKGLGKFT